MMPQRFLNNIVKPYDELNCLLVKRLAFEPSLSDVTRLAGSISTSIRHIPETVGYKDKDIARDSTEHRLIRDVSDAWKHKSLADPGRNNNLFVSAMFEYKAKNGFRFLRNRLSIMHATLGEHDFLNTALGAIQYWTKKIPLTITWKGAGKLLEAPEEFHETAFLFYDSQYCISMKNTKFCFFSRTEDGTLVAIDPDEARVEIYEKGQSAPKAWATIRRKEVLGKREAGIKTWKPSS